MERGSISVSTENIFPIIKKSLYADQEIFLRELVANATDASQKLKYLAGRGAYDGDLSEMSIRIAIDPAARTLSVSDDGIGMNAEEVKKYLNQIAFSGAEEFLRKYEDVSKSGDIIGKFGLGFYSAFMVAGNVEVISKSYRAEDPAVKWICDGTTTYSLEETTREGHGTDVILHISPDAEEFLEEGRIRSILNKYCKFLPVRIFFKDEQINQTDPIWRKSPTDIQDEEYLSLFHELYPIAEDPLFWIHLNVDFPFTLSGILYFPKIRKDIDPRRNQIQLYSKQVFITDEVKEIVPDYLMLLQGVIDSPDIPLNVSRSYLQSDSNVRKISNYITKKVADKLNEIYREDRIKFEEKWKDISVFVKYGMLTDDAFYEKVAAFALLEDTEGKLFTPDEWKEAIKEKHSDKEDKLVYLYATENRTQHVYIQNALDRGYHVLMMGDILDSHYIGLLERKQENTRWARVDSDTLDKLIPRSVEKVVEGALLSDDQAELIKQAFTEAAAARDMTIQTENLGRDEMPVLITRPEFMRRMKEMSAMGGASYFGEMPDMVNVVINLQHPAIQSMADMDNKSDRAKYLLHLALLSQHMLEGKELSDFIRQSLGLLNN